MSKVSNIVTSENSKLESQDTSESHKTKSESQINDSNSDGLELDDKWLIRDCDVYEDEYDECTSFKARFHQYFIYGETLDCNQWKKDYDNCYKWTNKNDMKAAEALINSEKQRRLVRLSAHYRNNIWEKRDSPPANWNAPLPEWMVKRDENSLLAQKAKEIKEGTFEDNSGFCSIM